MRAICARENRLKVQLGESSLLFGGEQRQKKDRISAAEVSLPVQGWHCQKERMLLASKSEEERALVLLRKEQRMKEMNKTYAIVEVIEGEQIQLVRN